MLLSGPQYLCQKRLLACFRCHGTQITCAIGAKGGPPAHDFKIDAVGGQVGQACTELQLHHAVPGSSRVRLNKDLARQLCMHLFAWVGQNQMICHMQGTCMQGTVQCMSSKHPRRPFCNQATAVL